MFMLKDSVFFGRAKLILLEIPSNIFTPFCKSISVLQKGISTSIQMAAICHFISIYFLSVNASPCIEYICQHKRHQQRDN